MTWMVLVAMAVVMISMLRNRLVMKLMIKAIP